MCTYTLIHISDLHFANNQSLLSGLLENRRILSKRHLGWINFKLRRESVFDQTLKARLLSYLESTHWDYLIITGDLTNLALQSEFEQARSSLDPLIQKGPVLLTAGNHDRYVKTFPESNPIVSYFQDCWPFNQKVTKEEDHHFHEIGNIAVVLELSMAVPQSFFSSRGRFKLNLSVIKEKLKNKYKDRVKIAIGHYPAFLPPGEHEGFFHSLAGKEKLRRFLLEQDFRFYLHGHIHKSWIHTPIEASRLTCVNSGGCCRHAEGKWSGFHRIVLSPQKAIVERIKC